MSTIHVRKARAGNTSRGRRWPTDGAVLELPVDEATELLALPDGGFTALSVEDTQAHLDAEEETARAEHARVEAKRGKAARLAGEIAHTVLSAAPAGADTPEPAEVTSAAPAPSPRPRRRRAPATAKE